MLTKTCAREGCGKVFLTRADRQRYCSSRCWHLVMRITQRGQMADACARANAARVRKQQARHRAKLEADFGQLTDRELTLIRLALQRGYLAGYRAASRTTRHETGRAA